MFSVLALYTIRTAVQEKVWQLAGDQQLVSGQTVDHCATQNNTATYRWLQHTDGCYYSYPSTESATGRAVAGMRLTVSLSNLRTSMHAVFQHAKLIPQHDGVKGICTSLAEAYKVVKSS